MDMFYSLLKEFGLPVALVLFFVWRDWKREVSMAARIGALENDMRVILVTIVKDATSAIIKSSDVMANLIKLIEKIPCISKGFCAAKNKEAGEQGLNDNG